MPLTANERSFLPSVSLDGWASGETRTYLFLDEGIDFTGDYGLTYIYKVSSVAGDENLFVRPKSALAIGLTALLSKEQSSLKGLKVDITKELGEKQKDTRYNCEVAR